MTAKRKVQQPWVLKWWPVIAFAFVMLTSVIGAWVDMRIQIAEVKTSLATARGSVGEIKASQAAIGAAVAEVQKDVAVTQEAVGALSDRLLDMGAQQGARSRGR